MTIELYKVPEGGCVLVLEREEAIALCAIHGSRSGKGDNLVKQTSLSIYNVLTDNKYGRNGVDDALYHECFSKVIQFNTK